MTNILLAACLPCLVVGSVFASTSDDYRLDAPKGLTDNIVVLHHDSVTNETIRPTSLVEPADPNWTPITGMNYSMTAILSAEIDGDVSSDPFDKVAAFAGSEVRGVASPTNIGGNWIFLISIASNTNGEPLTFRFYDSSTDEIVSICEGLNFLTDAVRGSISNPYILHESGGTAPSCALSWAVPDGFVSSMSVVAQVRFNGIRTSAPGDRVIAFIGNETRGVGVPFDAGGQQVYSIQTYGDVPGESLLFKLYKESNGKTYDASQTIPFVSSGSLGTPSGPFLIESEVLLPIEFQQIAATIDGPNVLLMWNVVNDAQRSTTFTVERRSSNRDYSSGAVNNTTLSTSVAVTSDGWEVLDASVAMISDGYRSIVEDVVPGRHLFRIRATQPSGEVYYSPNIEVEIAQPRNLELGTPFPNPASGLVRLPVSVADGGPISITIHDMLGRLVISVFNGVLASGAEHYVSINTEQLPSGVYTLVALYGSTQDRKRLVVVR